MKVLAINGSPRKGGNTEIVLRTVFQELEKKGIETELVQVGGKLVHGCTACLKCREMKDGRCHIKNDYINQIIPKMLEADGIILGSPVYFADITTEMKALIDISGYVTRGNGHLLRRKVGAAVVVERRGGAMHAFETLNNFFLINQMIIPGSSYWNFAFGGAPGDVLNDAEGLQTMRILGENMAWVMKKLG
jgi:multimeric flavodoxin WrbA